MATIKKSPIDSEVVIVHSTYEDNPFLPKDYVVTLQKLIDQDENYYKIYTLGEWGLLQNRIFTNYTIIPELPEMDKAKYGYGLDYGLVHPSAVAKVYLMNDRVYVEEKLYQSGLTVADIIEKFSHWERGDIWADPSSKMMTEEVRRAGYNAFDGIKGVKESIDLCQRQTLYIPESSTHLIKEIRSYKWKTDKDGHVLNEPVKFNDDIMDAMRYGIWGIVSRYGFPTQRPRDNGPISSLTFGDKMRNRILDRWMKREK